MPDYTWNQGRINSSTGVVDFTDTSGIVTSLIRLPLGSYEFVLPYVAVQFRKVTNGSESDVSYSNINRYIYLYDELGSFITRYQISNERYLFENANWNNAKSFRFECYYSGSTLMYPEVQQEMLGTYYYKVLCSFYFNVVEFHKENDIWMSDDSIPFSNAEVTTPIPASYWRIDSNSSYPYHENLKTIQKFPEPSIPASYWRIDRAHNNGYPWHERLLDISYTPPVEPLYKPPIKYTIVTEDGTEIYSSNNIDPRYGVINPIVTLEDNSTNKLEFTITPDHYFYNKIERFKTKCLVYRNGKEIFEGRVLSESVDFYNRRKCTFEGAMAYLNDTHQPQKEYSYFTINQIVESILDIHNQKVDDSRKIYKGMISVDKEYPRKDNYWYTQYESSLTAITNLVNELKAHARVRKDTETGKRVLDIFQNITESANQRIIFGSNLSDFTRDFDMGELVTVLLPLGKHTSKDEDVGNKLEPKDYGGEDTVAYNKYKYCNDKQHTYEAGGSLDDNPRILYLNSDYGDTSDYEAHGGRICCYTEITDPAWYQTYVYWLEVKPEQVFYLTASMPKNMLKDGSAIEGYFYSVRDANGLQLISKGAGTQGSGGSAIETITKEKITIPTGGAVMMVCGILDQSSYPFEFYESRNLPNDMESYITIEKYQATADHDADSLYIRALARDVVTTDQNGVEHTVHIDPYAEYGYVEKSIEFDDVEKPEDLYLKAKEYLEKYQYDQMTIELEAIDAKLLGLNVDDISMYQNVRCISPKHGLDNTFPVTKLTINLSNPSNNKIVLNSKNEKTMTANNSSINDELFNKIAKAGEKSKTIEAAKQNAYEIIKNGNTGIVSLNTDPSTGNVVSITISCDENWRSNGNYWIWNMGGLAYIRPNGTSVAVGMTNDGHVVCDVLAAETAIHGATLTNSLKVGATDQTHGDIRLLAPHDTQGVWEAMSMYSGHDSTDGNYGELVSYTEPRIEVEPNRYLQYFHKILNGKTVYGYRYVNSEGEEVSSNNRLTISTVAWSGGEERPTIDSVDGNLDIHSTEEMRLWTYDLYLEAEGSIYVYDNGTKTQGESGTYNGMTFVNGIFVGYEESEPESEE